MNALYRLLVRLRIVLLFIMLEVIAFVLLTNSSYFQHAIVISKVRQAKSKIDKKLDTWKYYFSLKEINNELAEENNRLRNQLEYYESIDTLTQSIAFDTLGKPVFSYISATIVTNSVNNLYNYITLNVGADRGIEPDMGVIVHNGLVGTVMNVSAHYSSVKSLLNVHWKVSAKLAKSGAFGSLYWDGKNYQEVLLTEIPQHIHVNVGDTVLSSGYSTLFPADIPIGTVKSFKIKRGNFYDITVVLFTDFKTLHHVNVVKHLYRNELQTIETVDHE